jgi:hypothetical protein
MPLVLQTSPDKSALVLMIREGNRSGFSGMRYLKIYESQD